MSDTLLNMANKLSNSICFLDYGNAKTLSLTFENNKCEFTAPCNGLLHLAGLQVDNNSYIQVSINGCTFRSWVCDSLVEFDLALLKGQVITININKINTWLWKQFIPCIGETLPNE